MNIEWHSEPRTFKSSFSSRICAKNVPCPRTLLVWRRSLVFVCLAGSWCVQPCVV
ncbi:hypothetical protein BDV36DRAFT_255439 [Aspergillus pseudocaelatus]|uniref:Uncharacterized protein n=1 Tax=Aspergillus pseudocaelatus TaxID=1825620 RepID=A0ABQ6WLC3_9EURO|nr:hypothetical protein BDV36DRAFT_255439 [Aspergillus pseudocaelatus]